MYYIQVLQSKSESSSVFSVPRLQQNLRLVQGYSAFSSFSGGTENRAEGTVAFSSECLVELVTEPAPVPLATCPAHLLRRWVLVAEKPSFWTGEATSCALRCSRAALGLALRGARAAVQHGPGCGAFSTSSS